MIIETTIKIYVSEENEPLVGYIADAEGIVKKNEEEMETIPEAIKRIMNTTHTVATMQKIIPHLERYFGIKDKVQFDALLDSLNNGAVEVSTIIKNNV